jgi:hypothetical protein
MFRSFIQKLVGKRANRLLLALGLALTVFSLYKLVRTAMYVHESVIVTATVTDVLQRPFESTLEALQHGNLAMGDSTSYSPIVRYTVPGGLVINRQMTDADDTDYTVGQQLEVITPALDPSRAHIYKWKFVWGWECIQLGLGVFLTMLGIALKERRAPQQAGSRPRSKKAPRKPKATATTPRKRAPRKKKS